MPTNPPKRSTRARPNAVPFQLREWTRRAGLLKRALTMLRAGRSLHDAAKALGEPIANLSRYIRAFEKAGVAGLVPGLGSGRPSIAGRVALTQTEARRIARLSVRITRRVDIAEGCRAYAASPSCRPALRAALGGRLPRSLREAIRAELPQPAK